MAANDNWNKALDIIYEMDEDLQLRMAIVRILRAARKKVGHDKG